MTSVRERDTRHPEMVVQVASTEWANDGRPRQPRYQGVRTDKPAKDVVRETA